MEELLGTTPEAPVAQEVPQTPAEEAPAADEPDSLEEQDDAGAEPDDDFEEVDFNGKKYSISKELAPIIAKAENLEAGVTKRFQEAAELRKQAEAQLQTFQREQQVNSQIIQEVSQLSGVEQRLAQYSQVNWQQWQAQDPQAANAGMAEMMQLQSAHQQLRGTVESRKAEIGAIQEQRAATQISQAIEALSKPDPDKGWAGKFDQPTREALTKFGKEMGYTDEELRGTNHPLMIKTLNLARIGAEALKKQKASISPPKPQAAPVPTVSAARTRSNPVDPDKMSQKQFNEWRAKQSKGR